MSSRSVAVVSSPDTPLEPSSNGTLVAHERPLGVRAFRPSHTPSEQLS
jgi:hypothetical protein